MLALVHRYKKELTSEVMKTMMFNKFAFVIPEFDTPLFAYKKAIYFEPSLYYAFLY